MQRRGDVRCVKPLVDLDLTRPQLLVLERHEQEAAPRTTVRVLHERWLCRHDVACVTHRVALGIISVSDAQFEALQLGRRISAPDLDQPHVSLNLHVEFPPMQSGSGCRLYACGTAIELRESVSG
eukprot:3255593-Rhodomonas_salina.2